MTFICPEKITKDNVFEEICGNTAKQLIIYCRSRSKFQSIRDSLPYNYSTYSVFRLHLSVLDPDKFLPRFVRLSVPSSRGEHVLGREASSCVILPRWVNTSSWKLQPSLLLNKYRLLIHIELQDLPRKDLHSVVTHIMPGGEEKEMEQKQRKIGDCWNASLF